MRSELSFILEELQSAKNFATEVYGIASKNQIIDELLRRLPGFNSTSSDCGKDYVRREELDAAEQHVKVLQEQNELLTLQLAGSSPKPCQTFVTGGLILTPPKELAFEEDQTVNKLKAELDAAKAENKELAESNAKFWEALCAKKAEVGRLKELLDYADRHIVDPVLVQGDCDCAFGSCGELLILCPVCAAKHFREADAAKAKEALGKDGE